MSCDVGETGSRGPYLPMLGKMMRPHVTRDQVDLALPRVELGLRKYCWLQERFYRSDVTRDSEFQRRFKGFYRVRRGKDWCESYFGLLERAKRERITFPDALWAIQRETGRLEASFVSKLLATVDPGLPVVDKIVLRHFRLRLPSPANSKRYEKTVAVYTSLLGAYREFMETPCAREICNKFTERYSWAGIPDLKKVDLVLWQIRDR